MAERLADVITQLHNVRQLEAVVTAMRGIAASRAQRADRCLQASKPIGGHFTCHRTGIGLAADVSIALPRRSGGPSADLSCFVLSRALPVPSASAYSRRQRATSTSDEPDRWNAWCSGRRRARSKARLVGRDGRHVDALPSFANRLTDVLYGYVASGAVAKVDVYFPRSASGSGVQVDRHSLLPIDFGRFARPIEKQVPLIALAPHIAGTSCGGICLCATLRGRHACIRSRKRSSHDGHDIGQGQHRNQAQYSFNAGASAPARRNHHGNYRACGGQRGADERTITRREDFDWNVYSAAVHQPFSRRQSPFNFRYRRAVLGAGSKSTPLLT